MKWLLLLTLWGAASAQPVWDLPSPARWLAAEDGKLVALSENGTVSSLASDGVTVLAEGWRGLFVVLCEGRVLGVDAAGRLAWADGDIGPEVSETAKPVCLEDGRVVAVAPEGRGLLLLNVDLQPLARLELPTLPDAQPTLADVAGDAQPELAVLTDPSARYAHGVLGDRLEALSVTVINLADFSVLGGYTLPAPYVFEGLRVMPTEYGIDGVKELLFATRSSSLAGAGVLPLKWADAGLEPLPVVAEIGTSHRWLNLFASRGGAAYAVRTPHIGGPLLQLGLERDAPLVGAFDLGVTNHAIGSRSLDLGVLLSGEGDVNRLVLPSQSLRELRLIRCEVYGACEVTATFGLPAGLSSLTSLTWEGRETVAAALLSGEVWLWTP